jgi:hypothetical protein
MTIESACAEAGKSMKTYDYYRRTDKIFADKVDRTRLGLKDKNFAEGDVHDLSLRRILRALYEPQGLSAPAEPSRCNRGTRPIVDAPFYEV